MTTNAGCLGALFGFSRRRVEEAPQYPYRVRDDFLSTAELSFFRVLNLTVADRAKILTKVKLSDVFYVTRPHENKSAYNRINQKHVDFLLCDVTSMKPLLGLELDDRSHRRTERQQRDAFVEKVFEAAGLPLARVPVRTAYGRQELEAMLAPHLGSSPPDQSPAAEIPMPTPTPPDSSPVCPKCGVPMVERTVGRGERRGEQFYGCTNYPKCRETLPLPSAANDA